MNNQDQVPTIQEMLSSAFGIERTKTINHGYKATYKIGWTTYEVGVWEPEQYNQPFIGTHLVRIDSSSTEYIMHVSPENLQRWILWAKRQLDRKKGFYKLMRRTTDESVRQRIEVSQFLTNHF